METITIDVGLWGFYRALGFGVAGLELKVLGLGFIEGLAYEV